MIKPDEAVHDFGAGSCQLRQLVNHYHPWDITDRYGATLLNLNDDLPEWERGDVAVLSGVIEYLDNAPKVLAWVASWADSLILTYAVGGARSNYWLNCYTMEELVELVPMRMVECRFWRDQAVIRFEC